MRVHLTLALLVLLQTVLPASANVTACAASAASAQAEITPDAATRIKRVSPTLYRGPRLSERVLVELNRLGVKTIVIARTNPQKKFHQRAKELGMTVLHLKTGVFSQPREGDIDQFLHIVQNPRLQPVYIACYAGEDRTSFFVAIYRMLVQNWPWEKTYEEMKAHDLKEWWYAFGRYKKTIKEYTEKKRQEYPSISSEG